MAEDKDFEAKYNELKAAHSLPDYTDICNEFDLHDLDDYSPVLPTILHNIRAKVVHFEKIIEEILQPDTTTASMNECNQFSDKEKEDLDKFYANLMVIDREILEQDIERSLEKMAACLNSCWSDWNNIKSKMIGVVRKMKLSWNGNQDEESRMEYFG